MKRISDTEQSELERQYKLIEKYLAQINKLITKFNNRDFMHNGHRDEVSLSFYMLVICRDLTQDDLKLVLDEAYKEHRNHEYFLLAIDQLFNTTFPNNARFNMLLEHAAKKVSAQYRDQLVAMLPLFQALGPIRYEQRNDYAKKVVNFLADTNLPMLAMAVEFAKNFAGMTKYEVDQNIQQIAKIAADSPDRRAFQNLELLIKNIVAGKLNLPTVQDEMHVLQIIFTEKTQNDENSSAIQSEAVEVFSKIIDKNKDESLICLEILLAAIKYELTSREMANVLTKIAANLSNKAESYRKFETVIKPLIFDPATERGKSFATKAAALYAKINKSVSVEEITKALQVFLEARNMMNAISPPEPVRPVSTSVSPPNTDPSAAHKRRKKNG